MDLCGKVGSKSIGPERSAVNIKQAVDARLVDDRTIREIGQGLASSDMSTACARIPRPAPPVIRPPQATKPTGIPGQSLTWSFVFWNFGPFLATTIS